MSYRILLVDSDTQASTEAEQLLRDAGYRAASVATFEDARRQIALDCPDLLITAVRLGAFNGVHLMLRCRADNPDLPVVVMGEKDDSRLAAEVTRYRGRFLLRPVNPGQILALVSELLAGRPPLDPLSTRRWPRKGTQLPATVSRTSAKVVDLSYGGMRLELPGSPKQVVEDPLDIEFPTLGFAVQAVPRWAKASEHGDYWWCGAELVQTDSPAIQAWRGVVNSLI